MGILRDPKCGACGRIVAACICRRQTKVTAKGVQPVKPRRPRGR
jgi:hypothetical protein